MTTIKTCFVMMPSGNHNEYPRGKEESDFVFHNIITPAVQKAFNHEKEISIIREVDNRNTGAITNKIIQNIAKSDLCIVDITGENPNVFFELGIRYALRRSTTILLRQKDTPIPFDITNYRAVDYSPIFEGVNQAIESISETIRNVLNQQVPCDSLVFDVFPEMIVEIPGVLENTTQAEIAATSASTMSWGEYWARLHSIVSRLKDRFQDGRFRPDVILGISNGGLMYADLLGRELFSNGIPILSLWADRLNKENKYFDNAVNNQVIEGIKSWASSNKETIEILMVDDIVASGTTVRQAVMYIKTKLPNALIHFLPLFSRNDKYFDLIRDHIVWLMPPFNFKDDEVIKLHKAEKVVYLPYNKEIRST